MERGKERDMAVLWSDHTGHMAQGQGVQGGELGEKHSITGCFCRQPGSISDNGGGSRVSLALGPCGCWARPWLERWASATGPRTAVYQ